MDIKGHWLDNQSVAGDGVGTIDVHNPATEEVLASVWAGTEADALRAVESAKAAFQGWRRTSAVERA